MKKKLIVFILMTVLIASVFLTGCTFIKENDERKANEVLATVNYDYEGQNISLTVTRNELVSYVNYIINLYSQYGLSYDAKALIEQGLDSLINQKYQIIQGMLYLMSIDHRKDVMYMNTAEYKNIYGNKLTPEGVLTLAERYTTIATTNENFKTNIDTYIEDFEKSERELTVSNARERLAALYSDGYTVKEEGGTKIYKKADGKDGEYAEGLYQTSFIYDADKTVEPDYREIYLEITMVKSGADDEKVYLPVGESAVTTEVDEDADFISNYITTKTCIVTYDEPKEVDGEDTYVSHAATAQFTLVTPRTAYSEPEEEDERDDDTLLKEGSVKFRYEKFEGELNEELQKIVDDGQIFEHTKENYASDAEKDAYRQFREAKKNLLINFDAKNDDAYNSLGYYYLSGFESAVLTAVQHELKRAALTEKPITEDEINAQYNILVNKQKEEYEILDNKAQIDKFAKAIGTDLTSAYYVPIDALKAEKFEYNGKEYSYATDNGDGTYTINMFYIAHILFKWSDALKTEIDNYVKDRDESEVKEIKTQYIDYLKTNKSKLEFATAEEKGDKLEDAFFTNEDGTITDFSVKDVLEELAQAMVESEEPLETFKEYMTYFNDDSGSMSSKLGYFVAMGDIEHSYDGDDFPNMAKDLYVKLLEEGKNPNGAKDFSEWAFTSYGLHIEYISFAPFYRVKLTENNGLGVNFAIDLDGTQFSESIKSTLENNAASKAYSEWQEKYTSDEAKSHAEKNEKKFKRLLKDLKVD